MHDVWSKLQGGVIISCQAQAGEPFDGPQFIVALAKSAVLAGAVGLRLDRAENIVPVKVVTDLPVIGLRKRVVPGSPVYITGTLDDAREVLDAGASVLAADATPRPHGDGSTLAGVVELAHRAGVPVLADLSCEADADYALTCGCDALATTLSGYTPDTSGVPLPDLRLLERLAQRYDVPIILEGGITRPEQIRDAFNGGAFAVVVGKAITAPHFIGRMYVDAAQRSRGAFSDN